jgi:hypothetical protein
MNGTDPAKPRVREFVAAHDLHEDDRGRIRCPWHDDTNPSMSLEPHGENYHCFSCDKSADVYEFAALFYGLDIKRDFPAIKKRVYGELGMEPPPEPSKASRKGPVSITPDAVPYVYSRERLRALGKAAFKTEIPDIEEVYPYRNGAGEVDFVECRYPASCFDDGKKKVLSVWFDGAHTRAAGCPVRLYNRDLLAARPELPVVIHEGAKCARAAQEALPGFVHTAYNGGGKKLSGVDLSPLRGRTVYIYPDDDRDKRVGMATAKKLKARIRHELSVEAAVVEPVPEARSIKPSGADIVEALQVRSPAELAEWIHLRHITERPRPSFYLDEGYELHEAAGFAAKAVNDFDENVFSREGVILRPVNGKLQTVDGRKLRLLLSEACFFLYRDRPASPPPEIVEAVLAGADRYFRPVREIVPHPAISPSGRVIRETGYDGETRCYFELPELEGIADAAEARAVLEDAFTDFPFRGQADRANLYALMLTFILRRRIDGLVPAFIIQAPVQGTGKSKLAVVALSVMMGGQVSVSFLPRDEMETQKIMGGLVMSGRSYIFFDNLKHRISNSLLEGAITGKSIDFRILGSSAIHTAENSFVFVMTSNNPQMEKDLVRRLVPVTLDANRERPDDLRGIVYRHPDIEKYVLARRPKILAALLFLARLEGPWDGVVMGSFEHWSRAVGAALTAGGISGFLENGEDLAETADEQEEALRVFVEAWAKAWGENPVCVRDLEACADEADILAGGEKDRIRLLSRLVAKNRNRIIAGYKIVRYQFKALNNRIRYVLKAVPPPKPKSMLDAWTP